MKAKLHLGTSGWSYPDWKKVFYPKEVKSTDWLKYYSSEFPTVEINNTFYHMPTPSVVEKWAETVPEGFLFSVKASRYITHLKRLKDCEESVAYLLKTVSGFKDKQGPILFQLPPSFPANKERLETFISYLDPHYLYVFEFRHESWFTDEYYNILTKHKIGLCLTDLNGKETPEVVTAPFTYLRLHGPHKAYVGSYGPEKLQFLKGKVDRWLQDNTSVFCYFDNDAKGDAVKDATTLKNYFSS